MQPLRLIFIGVILLKTLIDSKNVIQQSIKGNLSQSWIFNVTLVARDLKGIVLYCVDSNLNKLIIKISLENNGKTYLHLTYNNAFIRSSMNHLCGCDPCNQRSMIFYLELKNGTISIYCNKYGQSFLTESQIKDRIPKEISKIMKNTKDTIYVAMGNVDDTEDLDGCLTSIYFNRTRINFSDRGTKFRSSCDQKCPDGECNKGKCSLTYPIDPICDCSTSPLNGRYCNESLKYYIRGVNTSYIRSNNVKTVQFKVSWKSSANKTLCLMSLSHKNNNAIFTIDKGYLKMGTGNISPFLSEDINFMNVKMSDNKLTIEIMDKTVNLTFPTFRRFILNIGFLEVSNRKVCETFNGMYDIAYSTSELQLLKPARPSQISPEQIIIPIFVIAVLIFAVILAVVIRKRRKQRKSRVELETYEPEVEKCSDI